MSGGKSSAPKKLSTATIHFSGVTLSSDTRANTRTTGTTSRVSTTSYLNSSTAKNLSTRSTTSHARSPITTIASTVRSTPLSSSSAARSSKKENEPSRTTREKPTEILMPRRITSASAIRTITSLTEQSSQQQLSFTFVWLDNDVDRDKNNLAAQQQLERRLDRFKVFSNRHDCVDYIIHAQDQQFILVVSSDFAEEVISTLHDFAQLIECYVYTSDTSGNKKWTMQYEKVKEIITDIDGLIAKLTEKDKAARNTCQGSRASHDAMPTSIFSLSKTGNITVQQQRNERNADFMYFLLLIDILLKISRLDTKATQDLIEYSNDMCKNNELELKNIDQFEREYESKNVIWWYTRESFVYRLLNKAIRNQDYDAIFSFRLCITDLHNQLTDEHKLFLDNYTDDPILQVYRGQLVSADEMYLIQNSIGDFISMNTFLSTSTNKDIAMEFARSRKPKDEVVQMLYQFQIDTSISNTPAYARIKHLSCYAGEDEVLISLGSIFRIESVAYNEEEDIWYAKLSLCQKDDFELKDIMARVKEDIGDDIIGLGYLLTQQDKFDKARQCFHQFLNELSISDFDKAQCHRGLGSIAFYEENYDDALAYYQEALALIMRVNSNDKKSVAIAHRCLAEVYQWMDEQDLAFYHADTAKSLLRDNTLEMAKVYSIIANICRSRKRPLDALDYYEKVLNIRISFLPSYHPDIAITHNNIAAICSDMGDNVKALESLSISLDIKRKTLPPNNRSIQETEANIIAIQTILDNDDDVEENYEDD